MKELYRAAAFRRDTLERIDTLNAIVDEYLEQGLRLTSRQLYYQMVARGHVENTERSYKSLTHLVSEARLAGLIDWDAIEDRGREALRMSEWSSVRSLMDTALRSFRLPRWKSQPQHVELWVEKQALAGVLWPLAAEFHVTLSVNKGYSSQSAMHDAAVRMLGSGKPVVVIYLGDHDPSGEDMVRDVRDRLAMFGVEDLKVRKLALTMDQVHEFDPPPNPAKITDPRARAYINRYGAHSWEVDALRPETLAELIRGAISNEIDHERWTNVIAEEQVQVSRLRQATVGLR